LNDDVNELAVLIVNEIMDLSTAIIGLIVISLFTMPFVMIRRIGKKSEQMMLKSLNQLAESKHCKISQFEQWGNFAIGLDEANHKVFYHKLRNGVAIEQFLDLATIERAIVEKITRSTSNGTKIERLELGFIPAAKTKPEFFMEFYNSDISSQLGGELQAIEKWAKMINNHIMAIK